MFTCVGGDPNIGDYSSRTPLHNAAQYGNLEVIRRLKWKRTQCEYLKMPSSTYQKVTEALLAGGAVAGKKDKYGDTATSLAR